MSKMSQLHAELTEQANEMGYATIEDAERDGCHVSQDLVNGVFTLLPKDVFKLESDLEDAHNNWLKEREEVLGELISVYNDIDITIDYKKYIKHAIDFIKKGEI